MVLTLICFLNFVRHVEYKPLFLLGTLFMFQHSGGTTLNLQNRGMSLYVKSAYTSVKQELDAL